MVTILLVIAAVLLDYYLGEPKRYHPLVAFGRVVKWVEHKAYPLNECSAEDFGYLKTLRFKTFYFKMRGTLCVLILVLPAVLIAAFFTSTSTFMSIPVVAFGFDVLILYLAIGANSLFQHARSVGYALNRGDLVASRREVAKMVSRDTHSLTESEIAKAAVESTLENGNDAIFAAIFWFIVAGAPGVVLYRLANTLDAMWGYRNCRYQHFGWFAARLDDALNWLPARLTALSYSFAGDFSTAIKCWFLQGKLTNSPNAGVVMAAGAGALGVKLGNRAVYDGRSVERPLLGAGKGVATAHIERAIRLVQHALWLWILVLLFTTGGYYFV